MGGYIHKEEGGDDGEMQEAHIPSFTLIDCEVVLKLMIKGIKGYGRVRADTHGYIHTHAYTSTVGLHWLGARL
jgi:hypothetical protein